jgi:hypothetical protein
LTKQTIKQRILLIEREGGREEGRERAKVEFIKRRKG